MTADSFPPELATASADMAKRAMVLVAEHPVFRGHPIKFQFQIEGDVVVVRGEVPSFYLKQMVQNALKNLRGIRYVDNQVTVISSEGLSGQN